MVDVLPETQSSAPRGPVGARVWLRRIGAVLAWTVAITMGLLIIALVLLPRVVGAQPFTVLTGSMRPSMPPGTMVIVRPVEFADLRVGDVVTYQIESGKPSVVTHRIISIDITDNGARLRTQGDANPSADVNLVRPEQVRGSVWYWVPYIGYVTSVGSGDGRANIVRVLGGALIVYAAYAVVMGVVRSRRAATASSVVPVEPVEPVETVETVGMVDDAASAPSHGESPGPPSAEPDAPTSTPINTDKSPTTGIGTGSRIGSSRGGKASNPGG
jgi:signal peptidase